MRRRPVRPRSRRCPTSLRPRPTSARPRRRLSRRPSPPSWPATPRARGLPALRRGLGQRNRDGRAGPSPRSRPTSRPPPSQAFDSIVAQNYPPDVKVRDRSAGPFEGAPVGQGILISADLHYSVKNVPSRYDVIVVVVVRLESGAYAAWYVMRPDDTPKSTRQVLSGLGRHFHRPEIVGPGPPGGIAWLGARSPACQLRLFRTRGHLHPPGPAHPAGGRRRADPVRHRGPGPAGRTRRGDHRSAGPDRELGGGRRLRHPGHADLRRPADDHPRGGAAGAVHLVRPGGDPAGRRTPHPDPPARGRPVPRLARRPICRR